MKRTKNRKQSYDSLVEENELLAERVSELEDMDDLRCRLADLERALEPIVGGAHHHTLADSSVTYEVKRAVIRMRDLIVLH